MSLGTPYHVSVYVVCLVTLTRYQVDPIYDSVERHAAASSANSDLVKPTGSVQQYHTSSVSYRVAAPIAFLLGLVEIAAPWYSFTRHRQLHSLITPYTKHSSSITNLGQHVLWLKYCCCCSQHASPIVL